MSSKPLDIQNFLLNQCRRDAVSASVYLLKGVRLQGVISGFDNFVLTLRREGAEQLVYKHGIATFAARIDLTSLPEPDASGAGDDIQAAILERFRNAEVDAFLVNGVRLTGRLIAYDRFIVLIEGPNGAAQMIYKHALSSLAGAAR